jgi:hypothetical protein
MFGTDHTAMRNKTAKVKTPVAVLCRLHHLLDHIIAPQLVVLDGLVDANDVLPDDATSANVEMSDLGVAHKAFRKADSQRRGVEFGESGSALGELIHHGCLGSSNGVAILGRLLGGNAPAVNHDCTSERAP